ncbi:MtaA/CmuA family methyltransferase [Candidatus Aerophobetes bacterium]|nr:MtaA/CmuA family methyltransferase [Candidatus Aerophobetes bacterium]
MSPKRRFLSSLFGGRRGHRVPVGNPTSIVCVELMMKVGIHFPEAHLDSRSMAELAAAGHEILDYDTIMPEFSVQQEAAALGCEVDWGTEDRMPDIKVHPAKELKDIVIPENILEKPSLKVVLDAISYLRKNYGDHVAILGKVMGPWTLSYHLAGTEEFLTWTILNPGKVRRFLEVLKRVPIIFGKAQIQAGADVITLADHATGDLVSPEMYREFLLPVHKEIIQKIGSPVILHVCGNCADRLDYFAEAGFDAYHFEWQIDAKKAVKAVSGRMSLVGNISNIVLYQGKPEDIYKQVRYSIEAGVNIIAPECAVPLPTRLQNLKAIVEAAKEPVS